MTLIRQTQRGSSGASHPTVDQGGARAGARFWRGTLTKPALAIGLACSANAPAAVLGDAELRSYLGEPLQVRIALRATGAETIDIACIALSRETQPYAILRDAQIELMPATDTSGARVIAVRTGVSMDETFVRLGVRYSCAGQGATNREYNLLLDPKPGIATATTPATAANQTTTGAPSATATESKPIAMSASTRGVGQWQTTPVDTLANIAEGIYPKSVARKARYIAALRALNPGLADLTDDAPLPPGMLLTLPDLKALSAPERVVAPTAPARTAARPRNDAAPVGNTTKPATQPAVKSSTSIGSATPTPPPAAQPAPQKKPAPQFSLRLSGSEIDLSRSANVTEAQRALLREKQFFLDADDQLAQFLALKNAVKQLESRLNQLQARAANATSAPATTTAALPAKLPTTPAASLAPLKPSTAAPVDEPKARPSPAPPNAEVTQNKAMIVAPSKSVAKSAPPTNDPIAGDAFADIGTESWIAIVAATLSAAGLLAFWWRRRRTNQRSNASKLNLTSTPIDASADGNAPSAESFSDWERRPADMLAEPERDPQAEADELALRLRAQARFGGTPNAAEPAFDKTMAFASSPASATTASTSTETVAGESMDRFDLDDSPATTVDFPVGDQFGSYDEERTRRLQYMRQRYPELQHNTISLDDPDSVINAARHYLEDSAESVEAGQHDRASIDEAAELLGFAVEERPQEMRYWLAQFEVFRIEGMNAQYAELGAKFHVLFGHTPEWVQVKAIGHEQNPASPLFSPKPEEAEALATALAAINSPTGTQWLNQLSAPAADARRDLATLLRQSLVGAVARGKGKAKGNPHNAGAKP